MAEEKIRNNEMLNDEALDQIAGGTVSQTAGDSRFLYDYGFNKDYRYFDTVQVRWGSCSSEVDRGWSKAGVMCVTKYRDWNKYFIKESGKEVSRTEAYQYVMNKYQRIRESYI